MWALSLLVALSLWPTLSQQTRLYSHEVDASVISEIVVSTDTFGHPIIWPANMRNITYCVLDGPSRDSTGQPGVWGRTSPPSDTVNMERLRMAVALAAAEWNTVTDFQLIEVPPSRCLPPWSDASESRDDEGRTLERAWFAIDHFPSGPSGRLGDCPLHKVMLEWLSSVHGSPDPKRWSRHGEVWALLSPTTTTTTTTTATATTSTTTTTATATAGRVDSNALRGAKVVLDYELEFELLVSTAIHEFGHVLGLKHEWLLSSDIQNDGCFRDTTAAGLAAIGGGGAGLAAIGGRGRVGDGRQTNFDAASVMGYTHCGGTNGWSFQLSQQDRSGIQHLYGARPRHGRVVERKHLHSFIPNTNGEKQSGNGAVTFVTPQHIGLGSMSAHIVIDGGRLEEMAVGGDWAYADQGDLCPLVSSSGGTKVEWEKTNDGATFDLLRAKGTGKMAALPKCCPNCRCAALEFHMEVWWQIEAEVTQKGERDAVEVVVLLCSIGTLPVMPVHVAVKSTNGQHPYGLSILPQTAVIHATLEAGAMRPDIPTNFALDNDSHSHLWKGGITFLPKAAILDVTGVPLAQVHMYSSSVGRRTKPQRVGDVDVCEGRDGDVMVTMEGEGLTDDGLSDYLKHTFSLSQSCSQRVSHVNMDRNHITTFPRLLFDLFKNIRSLSANNNGIQKLSLPEGSTPKLQTLLVRGNSIEDVDASVTDHPAMTVLDLGENDLHELRRLPGQLTVLKIDSNELRRLPDSPVAVPAPLSHRNSLSTNDGCSLRHLDASYNLITEITPGSLIASCSHRLEQLDLSGNALSSFIVNSTFPKLSSLNLERNRLTDARIPFEHFPFLRTLDLSHNRLARGVSTSPTMGASTKMGTEQGLVTLDLSGNGIHSVDAALLHSSLRFLHLSDNRLRSLGSSFGSLRLVEALDIRHNKFTSIPEAIASASRLKHVDLSDNKIAAFPTWFDVVAPSLESLLCSKNRLQRMPEGIGTYQRLRIVEAADNQINAFPTPLFGSDKLPNLERVVLRSNFIEGVPGNAVVISADVTDLSHNILSAPSLDVTTKLTISYLNLSFNRLRRVVLTSEVGILKDILLSHNQLEDVTSHQNSIIIETCDLSHNRLNHRSILLPHARKVNLSYNKINGTVPLGDIAIGRGMSTLVLKGNPITLISTQPANYRTISRLKSLDLRGCPIDLRSVAGLAELWFLETLYLSGTEIPRRWATTLHGDDLFQLLWREYDFTLVGVFGAFWIPNAIAKSDTMKELVIKPIEKGTKTFYFGADKPMWPALRRLHIVCANVEIPEWLFELPSLELLDVQESVVHIAEFQTAGKVATLRHLVVKSSSVNGNKGMPLSVARAMTHLETARLDSLKHLVRDGHEVELPKLRRLEVVPPVQYTRTVDHWDKLRRIDPDVKLSAPLLERAKLQRVLLTSTPHFVMSAHRLLRLDLSDNPLSAIPKLPQLTYLVLDTTDVVWEPSLATWSHLRALDLKATNVGGDITLPTSLEHLYLTGTQVTSLSNLASLVSLIHLQASSSMVRELPADLSPLQQLARIEVDNCHLTGKPPVLGQGVQLAKFGFNKLDAVPPGPLHSHQMIQMAGNPLTSLEGFSLCNMLQPSQLNPGKGRRVRSETARLTHTTLTGWPPLPRMECAYPVKTLIMSENKLQYIPWASLGASGIRYWDLSHNNITSLEDLSTAAGGTETRMPTLVGLDLSGNALTDVSSLSRHAPRLLRLTLFNNSISTLGPLSSSCRRLSHFNLSRNHLSDLVGMEKCSRLRSLDLSHNKLESLPGDLFERMKYLTVVDLSNNMLEQLPALLAVKTLRKLDVSRNKLTVFARPWIDVRYDVLRLSHNKLSELDVASLFVVEVEMNDNRFTPDSFTVDEVMWFIMQSQRAPLGEWQKFQQQQSVAKDLLRPLQQAVARVVQNFRARVSVYLLPQRNDSTLHDASTSIEELRRSRRPLLTFQCEKGLHVNIQLLSVGIQTFESFHVQTKLNLGRYDEIRRCFPHFPGEVLINATQPDESVLVWDVGTRLWACVGLGSPRSSGPACSATTVMQWPLDCCRRLAVFRLPMASEGELDQLEEERLPVLEWFLDDKIIYDVGDTMKYFRGTVGISQVTGSGLTT